ncbi:GAF domain-containing protein [Sphingomonas sp. AR_OL41]|uniref:GAF domain-containing protein n=1 Tax=Sphingomonas sp. AR_OL41 TaxID=3042729 RepID=UPI0024808ECD|nr:GAF domain-containing protein [Sphingomonas sp. AR_OL41]MDH7974091.1 GAF domain-containing protein [Sphingomonas sp. AR_OL41]
MIRFNHWKMMSDALDLLGRADSVDDALEVLRARARAIGGADGVTLSRRDGDTVLFVGEDSVAPLWTGQRFPIGDSMSGLAMLERRPIYVPEVHADTRVPVLPYHATFVASLAVFPLGRGMPVAALGAYWAKDNPVKPDALALLDTLARSANATFERLAVASEIADSRRGAGQA